MPGIRLHHRTLRAGEGAKLTFVVELPRPEGSVWQPKACSHCQKTHDEKCLHLHLDSNGDVIVGTKTWRTWKSHLELAGFCLLNEVPKPPDLLIGAVPKDKDRIVELRLNGHTDAPKIAPSLTAYQSRDVLWRPYEPVLEAIAEKTDRADMAKKRDKRRMFILPGKGR